MRKLFLPLIAALAVAAVAFPATALGAPPSNDDLGNATQISSLPFSDSVTIDEATTEAGEPQYCAYDPQTVWYAITPVADGTLRADPAGTNFFDSGINVYRQDGSGLGGLSFVGCSAYGNPVTFDVQAAKTYYIQAGKINGGSGTLQLSVQVVPPPVNDTFANATSVGSLPFSDSVDSASATTEAGEPSPSCFPATKTVWYSFTPATSGSYSVSSNVNLATYSGTSLASLSPLGCRNYGLLTFHADVGTTYYFQEAGYGNGGVLQFSLQTTPPPNASFYYYNGDPSIYDTVQFVDNSYDPGQVGFQSESWNLGDGSSATGCCPTHRYAVDGDYTVGLTVTTTDGRSATTSQVVQVRTHDVPITKFTAPQSASASQTRSITVSLANRRYPETVTVQLMKSVAGGSFVPVGTSTQSVPVRGGNRTTDFAFNYTFTSDDAALGKVTFQAVASLPWPMRDALPADNTAISLPTKVNK
jgi:hypothetical protein